MKNCLKRGDRRLYRSRHGMIMGVCKGIGNYFDFSVSWIRFFCIIIFLFSGLWPMAGIYIIAFFVMKPEPVRPIHSTEEQDFYENYIQSRQGAIRTLISRFSALERRLRRIEDAVTSREFEWDRKFNE